MSNIKFNLYHVTNGTQKAYVWYSKHESATGKSVITLTEKYYKRNIVKVMAGIPELIYQNDSDIMTDYFDDSRVRIYEGHSLYASALECYERLRNKRLAKYKD